MDFIIANLHCHSNLSDGQLSPEELANTLSENNVQVASLTDHDTIEGQSIFRDTLKERGIGFISGIEMSAFSEWGELHLLGYNFDIENRELSTELSSNSRKSPHYTKAIQLIHDAGGKVFLAHPLTVSEDLTFLEEVIQELKDSGLDGIEAIYSDYNKSVEKELKEMAKNNNLMISAGTDYHGKTLKHLSKTFSKIDKNDWINFRTGIGSIEVKNVLENSEENAPRKKIIHQIYKSLPYVKIILPAVAGIFFFTFSIFRFFIPETENILHTRKKEMIKELTHSAVSILDEFNNDYENGILSMKEAQDKAIAVISHIRYGKDNKDYFWITNLEPEMIAHPYRNDLIGRNLGTYTDSNGEFVFVKIIEAVSKENEGFVSYSWQWKDEADIISPKLSYVKKYDKWGWVVGTGIYIDEEKREINKLEKYLKDISFFIIMILFIILLIIVLQNIKKEKNLKTSRLRLQKSDEKYRALADRTNEGTLIIQNGKCTYSNPSVRKMLNYSENELLMLTASELFKADEAAIGEILEKGEITPAITETEIFAKEGKRISVLMETGRIEISGQEGYIVNLREISSRNTIQQSKLRRNRMISELQSAFLFLSEPAFEIAREIPLMDLKTSIKKASKLMNHSGGGAFLVTSESGEVLGIVTDKDIRARLIAEDKNPDDAVYSIMTSPLIKADSRILIFEAVSIMKNHNIHHLILDNKEPDTAYVIRAEDLIDFHKDPAAVTAGELEKADSYTELQKSFSHVPFITKALIETGSKAHHITRVVSTFTDILIRKIIETAFSEIGPPPLKFAFIAPGSLGRRELTLSSDQDTAIMYEHSDNNEDADYFLNLGEIISDELHKAGFPYCDGGIMAKNREWCGSINTWKNYFSKWITKPESEELLHFNMFFDYRLIYGDKNLTEELNNHITATMASFPQFLFHLANSTSLYRAPVNIFGHIIFDSSENSEKITDIKEFILPIVNFARLYSLKFGIKENNTFARLDALMEKGIMHPATHNELIHIYDFLNQIRLDRHAEAISGEQRPDNLIKLGSLTHIENAMLKNAVNNIGELQKKINFDFRGTA